MFEASKVAMEFVRSIRRIVEIIAEHDPNLADQLRRASNATVLNTAEAGRRVGRDRCNRARMAAGEASPSRKRVNWEGRASAGFLCAASSMTAERSSSGSGPGSSNSISAGTAPQHPGQCPQGPDGSRKPK